MSIFASLRRNFKKLILLYLFVLTIIIFYSFNIFLYFKKEPLWTPLITNTADGITNETIIILENLRNQLEKVVITRESIEIAKKLPLLVKRYFSLCFIQIIDGKIYMDDYTNFRRTLNVLNNALHYILENSNEMIPNVEFVFSGHDLFHDHPYMKWNKLISQVPLVMMSKHRAKEKILLIPDAYMLEKRGYSFQLTAIKVASRFYGWKKKKEKVFWRGATSGINVGENDSIGEVIKRSPRYKLVNLSLSNQEIDAKFSSFAQVNESKIEEIKRHFGETDEKSVVTHLSSKYLISIDGNGCAWRRVPWILYSNSVLFKQETDLVEWFYPALKAFVHYVPIKQDLSDLVEKIEWCKQNDELAKKISREGSKFVEENLMPQQVLDHLRYFLVEYSKKQQFVLTKPDYDLAKTPDYDLW